MIEMLKDQLVLVGQFNYIFFLKKLKGQYLANRCQTRMEGMNLFNFVNKNRPQPQPQTITNESKMEQNKTEPVGSIFCDLCYCNN